MISATGRDDTVAALGAAELLRKPIHIEQLLAAGERHCL
jgi:hypothetical protein